MLKPKKKSSRQMLKKLTPRNLYRFKILYERLKSKTWTKKAVQELILAYDITCYNEHQKGFERKKGLNYEKFKHMLALNDESKFFIPIANGYTPGVQSRVYIIDDGTANIIDEIDKEYDKQRKLSEIPIQGSNFGFNIEEYYKITRKQREILRKHIIGINGDNYVIKNEEKGRYRIFSVFTRISENTRQYTTVPVNNDLSAGLQTLMMQFYKLRTNATDEELDKKYMLHFHLTNSSDSKKELRKVFAEAHGETIGKVKIKLTKISYGGMRKEFNFAESGYGDMRGYSEYYEEELHLRDFVLDGFDTLLEDQELREYYEAKLDEKKRYKREVDNLKLYTFMEYYERLIRDIMIELNPNVKYQHVHDSLWTSEEIDLEEVKKEIKKRIGFDMCF